MNLDEAIKIHEKASKEIKRYVENGCLCDDTEIEDEYLERADERQQLAKWLMELKEWRNAFDKIRAEISKAWYTQPNNRYEEGLKDQALKDMKIIDKYKAESEPQNDIKKCKPCINYENNSNLTIPRALSGACFHGEVWLKCPHCGSGNQMMGRQALYKEDGYLIYKCDECGKLFKDR